MKPISKTIDIILGDGWQWMEEKLRIHCCLKYITWKDRRSEMWRTHTNLSNIHAHRLKWWNEVRCSSHHGHTISFSQSLYWNRSEVDNNFVPRTRQQNSLSSPFSSMGCLQIIESEHVSSNLFAVYNIKTKYTIERRAWYENIKASILLKKKKKHIKASIHQLMVQLIWQPPLVKHICMTIDRIWTYIW